MHEESQNPYTEWVETSWTTENRGQNPIIISNTAQEFLGRRFYKCGDYYGWQSKKFKGNHRLHAEVWKFYNCSIPKGYTIHHVDKNRDNNQINNLQLLEKGKHFSLHSSNPTNKQREEIGGASCRERV